MRKRLLQRIELRFAENRSSVLQLYDVRKCLLFSITLTYTPPDTYTFCLHTQNFFVLMKWVD